MFEFLLKSRVIHGDKDCLEFAKDLSLSAEKFPVIFQQVLQVPPKLRRPFAPIRFGGSPTT